MSMPDKVVLRFRFLQEVMDRHGLDAVDRDDFKRFCEELKMEPTEYVYRLWLNQPDEIKEEE